MSKNENLNEGTTGKPILFFGAIDERTKIVVATGDSWACRFLMFALLLNVVCRGLIFKQASWDLFALVIIGGFISQAYQYRHHVFAKGAYLRGSSLMGGIGAIVALGIVALLIMTKWASR